MEDQTLENNCCNICGADVVFLFSTKDYISGEMFAIYQCQECFLVATKPDLKAGDFTKYYPVSYYGQRKSFSDYLINKSRLRKINKMFPDIRSGGITKYLLDVGCGDGGFISLLAKKGWQVAGTEVAPAGIHAHASPNCICRRELVDCHFDNASFDVVTMWHSLEHFTKPSAYLSEVERILKKDGLLLLEVPNFGSWQARFFKNNWFHLDPPRHVFHYDFNSIEMVLKKANFTIAKTSCFSLIYGFYGLLQSIFNIFCRRKNFLFDIINRKTNRQEMVDNYRDIILILFFLLPILLSASLVFLLESLFSKGSILIVWAKKI